MLSLVPALGVGYSFFFFFFFYFDPLGELIILEAPLGFLPGHLTWEPLSKELEFEALSAFSPGEESIHFSGSPFVNDSKQRAWEVVPIFRLECILYLLYQRLFWM